MKKAFVITVLLIITRTIGFTQSVGIGTTAPDASAVLELKATNKGFLPPRMTAAEKGLIPSPKPGLLIYQTDGTKGLYVYDGSNWVAVTTPAGAAVNAWGLTGNAGTNPATNFIGTTDNSPLKFKVNNITAGGVFPVTGNVALGMYALDSSVSFGGQNNAIGYNALHSTTYGYDNNAFGTAALYSNKTGNGNVAIGTAALNINISADNNTAIGTYALKYNTIGFNNVATGTSALYSNMNGNNNVAVGIAASYKNVSGSNNIAIGDSALLQNLTSYNVAIGSKALNKNTSGVSNTGVGSHVLYNNTTGNQNTGVGRASLYENISGIQNTGLGYQSLKYNEIGNRNVAVGFHSLFFNVTGNDNTALGSSALANNTGLSNTAIGSGSLLTNSDGFNNVAIGLDALKNNVSGSNNTAVGTGADIWGSNYTNATAIGAKAQVACSDCVVLGSITGYNGGTANVKVGIGTTNPQKTLHVNPNGGGGIAIGGSITSGGYTVLNMGISQESGGYAFLQGTKSSGTAYGNLVLNQSGGNVGIRTSLPLTPLHVKQTNDAFPFIDGGIRMERNANSSRWDVGVDESNDLNFSYNGAAKLYFDDVSGDVTTVSDIRMKKDIKSIETVLPMLMKLQAKTYRYKDNEADAPLSYGFIAQDVEKIFPDFVTTKGADNLKAVGYQKLDVMAIKAIQEQQVIIETQQKQIDLITQQNVLMMESIKKLQKTIEEINSAKK